MNNPTLIFVPQDYHTKPYKDWYDAFCKEFDCSYYTSYSEAVKINPDYFFICCGALSCDEMQALKNKTTSKIFSWSGDCRNELLPEVLFGKHICDITFLASGIAQKEMYEQALGHPVKYLQHAIVDNGYAVQKSMSIKGIVFIGNAYDQFEGAVERNELCAILSKEYPETFEVFGSGFNLPIYNNSKSLPFTEKYTKYNLSYISISANIFNNKEGYWSDRPLEIMAAGSCCLMRYVPNLENYFEDMVDCVFYRSNDEALEKVNTLLNYVELRNKIAAQGQNKVLEYHTYDYRVLEILKTINE